MRSATEKLAFGQQLFGALPKTLTDLTTGQTESWDILEKAYKSFLVSEESWPEPTFGDDILIDPFPVKDIFIEGLIERGELFSISATSKGHKSYLLLSLVLSLISGRDFMGFRIPQKRKVLLFNYELMFNNIKRRLNYIIERTMPDFNPNDIVDNLILMNLRGYNIILENVVEKARDMVRKNKVDIVIFDPIYRMLQVKDGSKISENDNSDMAKILSVIDSLTTEKCTVGWSCHYTKSNRSQLASMDRMAGAGVQARYPDLLVSVTELETDSKVVDPKDFRMEFTVRDFAPVAPINMSWEWPHFVTNEALASAKLKGSEGRPEVYPYRILVSTWEDMRAGTDSVLAVDFLERLGTTDKVIAKKLLKLNDDNQNPFHFRFEGRGATNRRFIGTVPMNHNITPGPSVDLFTEETPTLTNAVPTPAPEVTQ